MPQSGRRVAGSVGDRSTPVLSLAASRCGTCRMVALFVSPLDPSRSHAKLRRSAPGDRHAAISRADTSCRSRDRPNAATASCAPSRSRRSTTAAPSSAARPRGAGAAQDGLPDQGPVVIYPASGTGAWEAALVNTLSPGDRVLMVETGQFATLWHEMADAAGARGGDPAGRLAPRRRSRTRSRRGSPRTRRARSRRSASSTTRPRPASPPASPRSAARSTRRPSGAADGRHDLVARLDRLPPRRVGRRRHRRRLAERPDAAARPLVQRASATRRSRPRSTARLPRSYWDWDEMLAANARAISPTRRPPTCCYGLQEALGMLHEEGLDNVFARHAARPRRPGARCAHWGLEILCRNPREYSPP